MYKFSIFLCFNLIFTISLQSWAGGLTKEMECYKALIGHARGANYSIEDHMVLIPGNKGEKEGFYIFTDNNAHFCEFPNKPSESNQHFDYYYLRLESISKKPIYMSYSYQRSNPSNPGLSAGYSSPPGLKLKSKIAILRNLGNKTKHKKANCRPYLTDQSRNVLWNDLKARIGTVHSTFYRQKRIFLMDHRGKRRHLPYTYKGDHHYTAALKTCSEIITQPL